MKKQVRNLPASVHDRLLNLARDQGRPFAELFQYYAIERFLYRLAQSSYASKFILKGGLIFLAWGIPLRRPTRDIDLHGYDANDIEHIERIIKEICVQPVAPDGMVYEPDGVQGSSIDAHAEYEGVRVTFTGYLGNTRANMQVDVGFADAIVPSDIVVDYPTILNMPGPQLRGYAYETVIAEKVQAIVFLGAVNSRMKDFYDIWLLAQRVEFDGETLRRAIKATFQSRNTPLPAGAPVALTEAFAVAKQQQWSAFLRRFEQGEGDLDDFVQVVGRLRDFLLPVLRSAAYVEELTEREIDEMVIAQADDDDAWGEPVDVIVP